MSEEIRDVIAREILIVAALLLTGLTVAFIAPLAGVRLEAGIAFLWLYFARWVVWAGRRAAARPEHHRYLKQLTMLAATCLALIDLTILVAGFLDGGPRLVHLAIGFPVGTLAAFLWYHALGRHRRERRA